MSEEAGVESAAVELIAAYAANERPRYFAAFIPEANFIFPASNEVLGSRAAYEAAWQGWIDEFNFEVIDCISSNRDVKIYGDVAVFTHQTVTYLSVADGKQTLHERETIIFHKINGKWLAVHEHLSPLPE